MSEVKRWWTSNAQDDDNVLVVLASDYDAAVAERDALAATLERVKALVGGWTERADYCCVHGAKLFSRCESCEREQADRGRTFVAEVEWDGTERRVRRGSIEERGNDTAMTRAIEAVRALPAIDAPVAGDDEFEETVRDLIVAERHGGAMHIPPYSTVTALRARVLALYATKRGEVPCDHAYRPLIGGCRCERCGHQIAWDDRLDERAKENARLREQVATEYVRGREHERAARADQATLPLRGEREIAEAIDAAWNDFAEAHADDTSNRVAEMYALPYSESAAIATRTVLSHGIAYSPEQVERANREMARQCKEFAAQMNAGDGVGTYEFNVHRILAAAGGTK